MTSNPALIILRDNTWTHPTVLRKDLEIAKELMKIQSGKEKAGRSKTV